MDSALLGLVLDSSVVIEAERNGLPVASFVKSIRAAYGKAVLSISPVTISEFVHGIYRAPTEDLAARRLVFILEILDLVPVHPITASGGWIIGEIQGKEAAQGNTLPFNDLLIAVAALKRDTLC